MTRKKTRHLARLLFTWVSLYSSRVMSIMVIGHFIHVVKKELYYRP